MEKEPNLENAATKLAWGRVMNAGQVCIAPEYIVIHESVKDKFLTLIKEKIETFVSENVAFFKDVGAKAVQGQAYLPGKDE